MGTLLAMWPSLPLPVPPASERSPTMNEVAQAAANTIHRSVDNTGLMVVFERLDQIDSLTARVVQMLLKDPPMRLAVMAVMEPRWASTRATKIVDHLERNEQAIRVRLDPLTSAQFSALRFFAQPSLNRPLSVTSAEARCEGSTRTWTPCSVSIKKLADGV